MMPMELVKDVPMLGSCPKKISDGKKSIGRIKRSLIERTDLHCRCRRVNDMMCVIGLIGLVLMIIDTEFRLNQISMSSITIIRPLISVSSMILIVLVIYYHILDSRRYAINNHIADWRVTLKIRGLVMIICEIIACGIHPFPYILQSSSSNDVVCLDMFLSLSMFGRLYLIARSVTLHSSLANAGLSRTIGYLNRVPITISFVFRAFLQKYPAGCWSCVMVTTLVIASWSMHACEKGMWMATNSPSSPSTSTFINALWITIVTFTTLGYGDIVPQTHCGRGVSVLTALIGVVDSVVLIAVFRDKISLNRSEQIVFDFVGRINLARQHKTKMIQIIQYAVRAWFFKRRQRHFRIRFNSLYRLHTVIQQAITIKQQQRNATNKNESVITILTNLYYQQKINEKNLLKLNQHLGLIEQRINRIETKLDTLLTCFTPNIPNNQHSWL